MTTAEILQLAGYPADYIVLDFETYYDKEYSLTSMSHWEYITDERFEVLGVGGSRPNGEVEGHNYVEQPHVETYLRSKDFDKTTLVVQNAQFDVLILKLKYGVTPKYIIDIKHLAAHYDSRMSHRLKDLAKRFGLQAKGNTADFLGLHYKDMTNEQHQAIAEYCLNDIDLEQKLFEILLPKLSNPAVELAVANHTTGMYLTPRLSFDFDLAADLESQMQAFIDEACASVGMTKDEVSGDLSFTKALIEALPEGETIPVKPHKRPGKKMTELLGRPGVGPALAKTDEARQELEVHSDERVRNLMAARKMVGSWPLHIKRIGKIRDLATAAKGRVPVPLNYYGAHCVPGDAEVLTPHGWERLDEWHGGLIMQWEPGGNMRFLDATANRFKRTQPMVQISSPYIVASFTAGHTIPRFGSGNKGFLPCKAADLFGKSISYLPISGTSLDEGTISAEQMRVLVAVQADGHWQLNTSYGRELRFGLTKNRKQERLREILEAAGVPYREQIFPSHPGEITFRVRYTDCPMWLTPERKIFGAWLLDSTPESRLAFVDELVHWDGHKSGNLEYYSAIDCNHEWVATVAHLIGIGAKRGRNGTTIIRSTRDPQRACVKWEHVTTDPKKYDYVFCPTTRSGYWLMRQNGTISVTGNTGRWSGGGGINLQNMGAKGRTGSGNHAALGKMREMLMVSDSMLCIVDSAQIEARVLAWLTGEDDLVAGFADNRDVYSEFATRLFRAMVRKPIPADPPPIKKLLGLRRGFGKDTILGCGYGMGSLKFYQNCRKNPDLRPLFDSGQYDIVFVEKLINTYRHTYSRIPEFWRTIEKMFRIVTQFPHERYQWNIPGAPVSAALLTLWNDGGTVNVQLPSGRILYYPHASVSRNGGRLKYHHGELWGGTLTENIVQAIARDLLAYWILECENAGLAVVLHVHDEIIAVSSVLRAEENLAKMISIMEQGPSWAAGLPLAAEGCISKTYKK